MLTNLVNSLIGGLTVTALVLIIINPLNITNPSPKDNSVLTLTEQGTEYEEYGLERGRFQVKNSMPTDKLKLALNKTNKTDSAKTQIFDKLQQELYIQEKRLNDIKTLIEQESTNYEQMLSTSSKTTYSETTYPDNVAMQTNVQPTTQTPENKCNNVTLVGDSLVGSYYKFILTEYPNAQIDYKIGRQYNELDTIVRQLKDSEKVYECLIIGIGTNGPFQQNDLLSLIDYIGEDVSVYLNNVRVPRKWEQEVNNTLTAINNQRSNVSLNDWYNYSSQNHQYLREDGFHLTEQGAEAYASMVLGKLK